MAVRVKIAETAQDIDALFQLRHDVYVHEGGYMQPRAHGRVFDRFDELPGTRLMIAEVDGRAVGTVRFTADRGAGTHADDYYDFAPHLPADARVGSGSMLAVRARWRKTKRLSSSLLGLCICHALREGLTHLLGTVNPEVLGGFLALGFRPVDGVRVHEGLPFVPVVLRLDELRGRLGAFVDRHEPWSFIGERDHLFLCPGEALPAGPRGESYVVVRGELHEQGPDAWVRRYGPGHRVKVEAGERALAWSKVDLIALPERDPTPSPSVHAAAA